MIHRGEMLRKLALNAARLSGLTSLASRLTAGAGAILMLHRVTAAPPKRYGFNRHLAVHPDFLDAVLADMKRSGFVFVDMDEVVERLKGGCTRERFATITLDDGYRDNLLEALPVFERHGTPFTIYVAPALIEGTIDLWWDVLEDVVASRERIWLATSKGRMAFDCSTPAAKLRANGAIQAYLTTELPEEQRSAALRELARSTGVDYRAPGRETLMNWDEIRRISDHPLGSIGAHTMSHHNLRRLGEDAVAAEMRDGARVLELETGLKPRHFAYPYGYEAAVGPREVRIAAEVGFDTAVTTRHGVLRPDHARHLHALPRISINGRYQQVNHVRTMLAGVTTPLANRGRTVVTV